MDEKTAKNGPENAPVVAADQGGVDVPPAQENGDTVPKRPSKRRRTPSGRKIEKVVNRRRRPGEVFIRSTAIRNHCRECCGWESDPKDCPAVECHLWPYRLGPLDPKSADAGYTTEAAVGELDKPWDIDGKGRRR